MKDFREMMTDAMDGIEKDGFIEKTLREALEKTVARVIEQTFQSYSDFGKSLQEAIKNEVKIDFSQLGLGAYSTTITAMLSGMMKEKMDTDARLEAERFLQTMGNNKIPAELKITDMVNHIVEDMMAHDEEAKRDGFDFTFHYIQRWPGSETLEYCYNIRIDKEPDVEPSECEIDIDYDAKRQEITDVTINKKSVKNTTFYTTRSWDVEGYIFQLYANKVKLIDDAVNVETCVAGENEY